MATETILNRKALRDFHILERYKAGIELKGSEVKSIRAGKANISDAFVRIERGEAFLHNADIQPYERASHEIPPAKRVRRLLLHKQEIEKLEKEVADLQPLRGDALAGPLLRSVALVAGVALAFLAGRSSMERWRFWAATPCRASPAWPA